MKLIVFDLDGTLIDSVEDLSTAINATLKELGLPERSLAEVRGFVGDGVRTLLKRALPSDAAHRVDEALPLYRAHYRKHLHDKTKPYPGIDVLLKKLHVPLAIATNKPAAFAQDLVRVFRWEQRFSYLVGGDSLPVQKPDAGVLQELCRRAGVQPADALMVGDGPQDLGAAQAAGTKFCGVTWGFRPDELRAAKPELLVDTPQQLERVLTSR